MSSLPPGTPTRDTIDSAAAAERQETVSGRDHFARGISHQRGGCPDAHPRLPALIGDDHEAADRHIIRDPELRVLGEECARRHPVCVRDGRDRLARDDASVRVGNGVGEVVGSTLPVDEGVLRCDATGVGRLTAQEAVMAAARAIAIVRRTTHPEGALTARPSGRR
jgi:hypothetical protein